jgi:cytochrome c peroxidase
MKKLILSAIILIIILAMGCDNQEGEAYEHELLDGKITALLDQVSGGNGVEHFKFPAKGELDKIPQDPNNPITDEKILLGKLLFHESALGILPQDPVAIQTYSCASCHFAGAGFQAGRIQGLGDGGMGFGVNGEGRSLHPKYSGETIDAQPIRSPTVLNSAYQKNMLWNGQFGATGANVGTNDRWTPGTPKATNELGFEGVETQAIAGLNVHRMDLDNHFIQNTLYKTLFDGAFPQVLPAERYTRKNTGLAIAAYERTVLADQAPFQLWLNGNSTAMTLEQKKGAVLFFGTAGCATCHNSAALNDENFYALGMKHLYQETAIPTFKTAPTNVEVKGRGGFTGKEEDNYKFKTPQLYNLKDSPFYGHGGSFRTIEEVIRYKNAAIPDNNVSALSPHFQPLNLSDEEIAQLVDFIENALYDNNLQRYVPNSLPSGFCFPNNDMASKNDLGCN